MDCDSARATASPQSRSCLKARMTASWSGSERTYRIQVCGAKMRPNGELPSDQYAARRTSDTGASKKGPSPCPSSLRVLRGPDCRRRDEKRPFPLRTKNSQHNPKQPLDRKSPIQVRCELDLRGRSRPPRDLRSSAVDRQVRHKARVEPFARRLGQYAAIAALHRVVCSKRRGPLTAIRTGLKPAGWSAAFGRADC